MDSCKTWNNEMTREFSPYKRVMWPVGSWPLDSNKNFAKLRVLFITVTQVSFYLRLFQIILYFCTNSHLPRNIVCNAIICNLRSKISHLNLLISELLLKEFPNLKCIVTNKYANMDFYVEINIDMLHAVCKLSI
jgi:hypothetical protein